MGKSCRGNKQAEFSVVWAPVSASRFLTSVPTPLLSVMDSNLQPETKPFLHKLFLSRCLIITTGKQTGTSTLLLSKHFCYFPIFFWGFVERISSSLVLDHILNVSVGQKICVPTVTLEGATGKRQTNQSVLDFLSTEMTFTLFQICLLMKVGMGSLLCIESQGYSDI